MRVTLEIPDDMAKRLQASGDDLSRRALEGLALEEFRCGRLSKPELRQLLGFATRDALDGFLKEHGEYEPYSIEDLAREQRDLERLGF